MPISKLSSRINRLEKAMIPDRPPAVALVYLPDDMDAVEREQKLAEAKEQAGPGGTVLSYTGNINPDLL